MEVFQYLGQRVHHVFAGLLAVVKHDDGAGACILGDIAETLLAVDTGVKVTTQHIPHHDLVVTLQELDLLGLQPSVGRAEESGIDQASAVAYVVKVWKVVCHPTIEVVEGVVAKAVSFFGKLGKSVGVLLHIVTHAKESCFGIVVFQLFEHPRRHFRMWAIVESEVEDSVQLWYGPNEVGKHFANKLRCLNQVHH